MLHFGTEIRKREKEREKMMIIRLVGHPLGLANLYRMLANATLSFRDKKKGEGEIEDDDSKACRTPIGPIQLLHVIDP